MNTSAVQPEGAPARYYAGGAAEALDVSARWGIGDLVIFRPADDSIVARWRLEDLVMRRNTTVSVRGSEARLVVVSPELRAELARVPYLAALVAPPSRPWWRRLFKP